MSDNRLKSLAERIERLMDERDGIQSDIRDIYAEAKSAGYVPKVLRKAIMRKRMDASKRDEEDAILELYEDALGAVGKAVAAVRAGSTWKEASEEHDVPRATLARAIKAVSKQRNDTAAEITTAGLDTSSGEGSDPTTEGHSASLASDTTSAALHGIEDSFPPSADPQTEGARPSSSPALSVGIEAGPIHARQDDGLDIPPFLRRQRASA